MMEQDHDVLARLGTRGFVGRPGRAIVRAAATGMGLMMAALMVGAHPLLAMLALLAGIVGVLLRAAGRCVFVLTRQGLERTFTPFWSGRFGGAARTECFAYGEITSYRVSRDLSRQMREIESLRFDLVRAPRVIVVTDELAPLEYATFRDAFVAQVEDLAHPAADVRSGAVAPSRPHRIVRRPDFYETRLARVVTVLFVALTLALLACAWGGLLSATHLFRLAAVIAPGTLYMLVRTFGSRRAG